MNNIYESELKHHGILGQKWGVRRFQNSDGSLKPAGKKRYSNKNFKVTKAELNRNYSRVGKNSNQIEIKAKSNERYSEYDDAKVLEMFKKNDNKIGPNTKKLFDQQAEDNAKLDELWKKSNKAKDKPEKEKLAEQYHNLYDEMIWKYSRDVFNAAQLQDIGVEPTQHNLDLISKAQRSGEFYHNGTNGDENMLDIYESELKHHGILGQKWGVRRYQNPDGSLTPEGKERYYTLEKTSGEKVYTSKSNIRSARKQFKKDISKEAYDRLSADLDRRQKEINENEEVQKFYKGIAEGKYVATGRNSIMAVGETGEETADLIVAYKTWEYENKKAQEEMMNMAVDELLKANDYKVTEEGRKACMDYIEKYGASIIS